jgi:hypothetical protein
LITKPRPSRLQEGKTGWGCADAWGEGMDEERAIWLLCYVCVIPMLSLTDRIQRRVLFTGITCAVTKPICNKHLTWAGQETSLASIAPTPYVRIASILQVVQ